MVPKSLEDPETGGLAELPWRRVLKEYDPELYTAWIEWNTRFKAAHKELDLKTQELMIVAFDSYLKWPSPFINVHIHWAFDAGATIQEVLETISLAARFGGGHAYNHGLTAMGTVIEERKAAGVDTPRRRA